jgi:hypothetical protein
MLELPQSRASGLLWLNTGYGLFVTPTRGAQMDERVNISTHHDAT